MHCAVGLRLVPRVVLPYRVQLHTLIDQVFPTWHGLINVQEMFLVLRNLEHFIPQQRQILVHHEDYKADHENNYNAIHKTNHYSQAPSKPSCLILNNSRFGWFTHDY